MRTRPRVVRKATTQPAKPRRLSAPKGGHFASSLKRGTSRTGRGKGRLVRRCQSNTRRQFLGELEQLPRQHNAFFRARRSPQTGLQPGNLYGFPTAATDSCQERFVSEPNRVLRARCRIPRALPLARETITLESESILGVTASVWPGGIFNLSLQITFHRELMVQ